MPHKIGIMDSRALNYTAVVTLLLLLFQVTVSASEKSTEFQCLELQALKLGDRVNVGVILKKDSQEKFYEIALIQKLKKSEGAILVLHQAKGTSESKTLGNFNIPLKDLERWFVRVKSFDVDKGKGTILKNETEELMSLLELVKILGISPKAVAESERKTQNP